MKKLIALVLFVPAVYFVLWLLPIAFQFAEFLFILDNTDFGIPWWFDLLIDSIAGGIAFVATNFIFGLLDKESKATISNVLSIIIGFVIAVVVHILMRYWIVIVSILGTIVIAFIVYKIVVFLKSKKKAPSES